MQLLPKLTLSGLLALSLTALTQSAQAQVNINITPPSWGPAVPAGTQYYYVPEYGGYYDLRDQRYIVERNGKWQRLSSISGYTPSSFHPVAIDYKGNQPWTLVGRHRTMYPASLPPGQVKRLENGKGLPPGQAKKVYGGPGNGKGYGKGKH
ncbi:hypothetical protein [Hymenobacter psychrotolerans]|uniref:Uncharacterized protein n=1 Tax=Hymenobacter psychrotolerans DSM 18569 TaxID=1121959 RepID=A0A1M6PQ55_9BACT|nr:hypothetical protein [Hymenobacter psychrotolerans]SHK10095.1 hypothetical protein SAMN02746009_00307 [Hymenobacter psychrotolerans DSM 18569]